MSSARLDSSTLANKIEVEDILEKRIAELEKKVFGLITRLETPDKTPETSVIESILQANSLLSSALSGREKINTLIQRLPEIENYMKSDCESADMQIEAKLEYILAMEPEIREQARKLNQLKELLPVLDSDRFNNLPELTEKLNKLSVKYINLGTQTEKVNADTRDMVSRYNEIMMNISKSLISLDAEITELEKQAEPKKVME